MKIEYRLLVNFSLIFTFCNASCHYSVSPIMSSFNPQKIAKNTNRLDDTVRYSLTNKSQDPVALEVKVYERSMDEDGKDNLSPSGDFHINQPQLIMYPKESVKIILRYKKKVANNEKKERAFRVCFEQIPIKKLAGENAAPEEAKHTIVVNVNVTASLYMTPKDAKPDISVSSVNEDVVLLKNKGTMHISAKDISVPVAVGGKTYAFGKIVHKEDEEKVILADGKRKLRIDRTKLIDANILNKRD